MEAGSVSSPSSFPTLSCSWTMAPSWSNVCSTSHCRSLQSAARASAILADPCFSIAFAMAVATLRSMRAIFTLPSAPSSTWRPASRSASRARRSASVNSASSASNAARFAAIASKLPSIFFALGTSRSFRPVLVAAGPITTRLKFQYHIGTILNSTLADSTTSHCTRYGAVLIAAGEKMNCVFGSRVALPKRNAFVGDRSDNASRSIRHPTMRMILFRFPPRGLFGIVPSNDPHRS